MRINSVPDVKCFYNNKNVLRAQSMVWHFVRHPVDCLIFQSWPLSVLTIGEVLIRKTVLHAQLLKPPDTNLIEVKSFVLQRQRSRWH